MELLYADDLVLIAETKELLLEKVRNWKKGMEKKGLRVNAGKTKVMWCRRSMGQADDSGEHPCGVAGEGLATTQSFAWSVVGGFTKDVVAFQESQRVMLISIVGGAWRVRMASFSQFC